MPVSRLCRARIHDWGDQPGAPGSKCIRCGKEYGKKPGKLLESALPVPPRAPPAAPRPPAVPRPPAAPGQALASSDALRRAAARISGKPLEAAAVVVDSPAAAVPAELVTPPDGAATRAAEEESTLLADLVRPLGPNVLVNGSAGIINHGLWLFKPRKALEPDPDFLATFTKQWQRSVTRLVPKLELHPVTATLLSATAVLGSMWWCAPLMDPKAPELPPLPPSKGEERCPPKQPSPAVAPAAGSADTPLSAQSSSNGLTPLSPIPLNPSETSATTGDAESVEPDA